jgi:hypothetical protein
LSGDLPRILVVGELMIISRSLSADGNFAPSAINFLKNIPEKYLFHTQQRLRHPAAIYSFSLAKISEAFDKVVPEYLSKTSESRYGDGKQFDLSLLLAQQETLLKALQEHIDDCYLILKTLVDPSAATKNPLFTDRYVIENKLPGAKYFQRALVSVKSHLQIANKLKHQQGRLRGVAAWPPASVHFGYFMEEPDDKGVLGPSADIHPDQGAFSFSHDLPLRLWDMYVCSEKLVEAVKKALSTLYRFELVPCVASEPCWESVIGNICKLPLAIFPKERQKPVAKFVLVDQDTLEIHFPVIENFPFSAPLRMTTSTKGDGYSTSFKVPLP